MPLKNQVALNFLSIKEQNFTYRIYRRMLGQTEQSMPGMRWLPDILSTERESTGDRKRYEISLVEKNGFEPIEIPSWISPQLTVEVIHCALMSRISQSDISSSIEHADKDFKREVAFTLKTHAEGVKEVMWLRAFAMKSIGKFGYLCSFRLKIPKESTISPKRKLELSLTQKNGRVNEAFYLDRYQKIGDFLTSFFHRIQHLELHDGSQIEIEGKLSVVPSFTLSTRTYVFSGGRENKNQFFGLRDLGPFAPAEKNARLAFVFKTEDRANSQDLFRALRGDTYSTFSGMEKMFRASISKLNTTGIEVKSFGKEDLLDACDALKKQFPNERILPIALVPFTKHSSDDMTLNYFRAKHSFLNSGLASQFIDRTRTMGDKNALKWSISNIGLAIFAKMGGTPWRVKPSTQNCLIVGIGQAHIINDKKIEKYVAYSVLTDSSGIYETIKVLGSSPDKTTYLDSLKTNLKNVLLSHKDRYTSFVLHVTFSLKRDEIEAIKSLLDDMQKNMASNTEFVVIKFNDHNDFFGFSTEHNSRVPYEGTVASISNSEFVMWCSGVGLTDSKAPKKPERPVHLKILYPESPLPEPDLRRLLQDAINIAGANWRGFNAKSMPISVYYAKLIADYYGRFREAGLKEVDMDNLPPWFL